MTPDDEARWERQCHAATGVASLGLDPTRVTTVEPLHRRRGSALYRIWCGAQSFILKEFLERDPVEPRSYALLGSCGVPTLRVHGCRTDALLLEDLAANSAWRLANEADGDRPETGTAVAEWYRALHAAGRTLLSRPEGPPGFLKREADVLDGATILGIGLALGIDSPAWALAAEHIEGLKAALRALPETLNHNDFHWTNLALSRHGPLRAIVFDHHLLGIGPAFSDWRNVSTSLEDRARVAFQETYGPVEAAEEAAVLDAPVSLLVALHAAVGQPKLPRWAETGIRAVRDGQLERMLRRAAEHS
ncbi:MAG: phosphotransferase [Armatimonadetes bacterium]|nr:phosphotransferase [Armatimonadota bacterium]